VGGGPAGLAAAIALRMRGADVLVADALKPPIDKACGEGLMPDARRDLAALGVSFEDGAGAPFRGIRFVSWTDGEPVSISADFVSGPGVGIRRTLLHSRMVERAMEVGVRLRWGTRVALGSRVALDSEACSFRYMVGADGQSSRVRAWAGLDRGWLISRRFGFRRHYQVPAPSSNVEVHWCDAGQVYITPVAQGEICVAAVTRHNSTRMGQVIGAVPYLRDRLSGAEASTGERGALTTTRRLRCVARGNVALIGDASGSVDAVTGEGLAIGFRQAGLLSQSLEQGALDFYAAEHEKTMRMPGRMARVLLLMDAHPALRRAAQRVLAGSPGLFGELLQVHMGEESLRHFLIHNGAAVLKSLADAGLCASESDRASA